MTPALNKAIQDKGQHTQPVPVPPSSASKQDTCWGIGETLAELKCITSDPQVKDCVATLIRSELILLEIIKSKLRH